MNDGMKKESSEGFRGFIMFLILLRGLVLFVVAIVPIVVVVSIAMVVRRMKLNTLATTSPRGNSMPLENSMYDCF